MNNFSYVNLTKIWLMVFVFPVLIFFPIYAEEDPDKLELEKQKLDKEIELLEKEIDDDPILGGLFQQGLAIIGVAGAAVVAAFFAWIRERNIPPKAERIKISHEIIKEWYFQHYLPIYEAIWKNITNTPEKNPTDENQKERVIMDNWKKLCTKEFDTEQFRDLLPEGYKTEEQVTEDLWGYLKKNLKLKDDDKNEYNNIIKSVRYSGDVKYYDGVFKKLPELIQFSIETALSEIELEQRNFQTVYEKAFKHLRPLMIFTRTREIPQIVEILLKAKVSEKLRELAPNKDIDEKVKNQTQILQELKSRIEKLEKTKRTYPKKKK